MRSLQRKHWLVASWHRHLDPVVVARAMDVAKGDEDLREGGFANLLAAFPRLHDPTHDQPCIFQNLEVRRDRRLRQPQLGSNLVYVLRAVQAEELEDGNANRTGEPLDQVKAFFGIDEEKFLGHSARKFEPDYGICIRILGRNNQQAGSVTRIYPVHRPSPLESTGLHKHRLMSSSRRPQIPLLFSLLMQCCCLVVLS